ncbi:MAG TPA: hypothetical protein VNA28_03680 [Solirubrobacteraceae bacterium]|nr:hypothetical protein [Solirubrobacteraceae bacterium]
MSVLATILATAEHAAEAGGQAAEGGAHAAEEEHKSEAPFFIVGGMLALFAIVISIIGFKKPDFPASASAARGVMTLGLTLTLATMASVIYVAT